MPATIDGDNNNNGHTTLWQTLHTKYLEGGFIITPKLPSHMNFFHFICWFVFTYFISSVSPLILSLLSFLCYFLIFFIFLFYILFLSFLFILFFLFIIFIPFFLLFIFFPIFLFSDFSGVEWIILSASPCERPEFRI